MRGIKGLYLCLQCDDIIGQYNDNEPNQRAEMAISRAAVKREAPFNSLHVFN